MDEHRKFLADRLLSEGRPISYGALSASLDVHVNKAKGILFDFHQYQNGMQENSVHATYLVCGVVASTSRVVVDTEMDGSPRHLDTLTRLMSPRKLTLVGEENLQEVLDTYESITSIHLYALSPMAKKAFWFCEESVYQGNDGGAVYKNTGLHHKLGVITNPHVRLRDRNTHHTPALSSTARPPIEEDEQVSHDKKNITGPSSTAKRPHTAHKKEAIGTINRAKPNSILKSFAKANIHAPGKLTSQVQQDDGPAALSDDGEPDDWDILPSKPTSDSHSITKSRRDREDALRRMMEDEDDGNDEAQPAESAGFVNDNVEMTESPVPEASPGADPTPEKLSITQVGKEPSEILSSTGDGRRRGKRRIMKKKRILDDQGYMVTIQEPGWESFSEDETLPPTKKPTSAAGPTQFSSSAKTKTASLKGSQGSIMSFFAKK